MTQVIAKTVFGLFFWAISSLSAVSQDLTVGVWQGEFSSSFNDSILDYWQSDTGMVPTIEPNTDALQKIKASQASGRASWDVVTLSGEQEHMLCQSGSIASLAEAFQSSLDHLNKPANCGVPFINYGQTIVYKDNVSRSPLSALDFFDQSAIPGKRGLSVSPKGTLEMALLADGVKPDDIYATLASEDGLSRAFAKLDAIKTDIVWWSSADEALHALENGEITISTAWSGTVNRALQQGSELVSTKDFVLVEYDYLAIPSTATNIENAKNFVSFATEYNGLQTIYEGFSGIYSVPSGSVNLIDDPTYAQACAVGACPCARGGCSKDCCKSDSDLGGHFEIDQGFWAENSERMSQAFDAWRFAQ